LQQLQLARLSESCATEGSVAALLQLCCNSRREECLEQQESVTAP